ncbi:MAG: DoxX family protein [Polyangiaceae bacterium]|nr:DoxX family protein [Polyangiaceae bacterium]
MRWARFLSSPLLPDLGLLTIRLWFGLALAFGHGLSKVLDVGGFAAGVGRRGIPLPEILGPAAAASELLGGLLLAIGLFARPSAFFVVVTMLVAALFVHAGDPFAKKELALCYAMAALALLLSGAGRFSVDAWWSNKRASAD